MARTARTRALRSGANPSTLDVFGTATSPNTATRAFFPAGLSTRRYLPNDANGEDAALPGTGTAASGRGWRDSAPENPDEIVNYAAGTWTVRTKVRKTGQVVPGDVTVRLTSILYHVANNGTHKAEVGRAVTANTVVSTADLVISSSFTTSASLAMAANDNLQVEIYLQSIDALGNVAHTGSFGLNMLLDETNANNASAFTAQPTYDINYRRTLSTTALGTPTVTTGGGNTTTPISAATTATGTAAMARRITAARAAPTSTTGTPAMARRITAARTAATSATGTATEVHGNAVTRSFAVTAGHTTTGRVDMPMTALNRIIAAAPDWPLNTPTKVIAGVTRNSTGGVVTSATVKLVRQSDDVRVASTTSDATTGAYSFTRGGDDPNTYYVLAYRADAPEIHGVTDRGLVPA